MLDEPAAFTLWVALFGLLGLAVGSFLNVVIWRVPLKASVVRPPSHCPNCEAKITPRDNIPVVSWVLLRGRCRHCGARISVRYPLVELATGGLFAGLAARFEIDAALPAFLLLGATLLAVGLIDLEHYIVPNRILIPVTPAAVGLLAVAAGVEGEWSALGRAVLGGAAAFVGLLVVHLISPRGMGMGDVKLAFLLGLLLGWISWGHVGLGLFLGFFFGAIVGIVLVATGLRSRREAVPFAPFLAVGTLVAVFAGTPLLDWYTAL